MTQAVQTPSRDAALAGARLTFPHLLRAEAIKLRTLRSTWWCAAIVVVLTAGFSLLVALFVNRDGGSQPTALQEDLVVRVVTVGVNFAQLVTAVLGVLAISGEYGTGMIRATFTAVPKRLPAVLAKLLVVAAGAFLTGLVAIGLALLVAALVLPSHAIQLHLDDSAVWMPLLGAAVFLALVTVLAFAIGALVRSSAAGIAIAIGLLVVVPIVVNLAAALTQQQWLRDVAALLPGSAGGQLFAFATPGAPTASGPVLNGWGGLGVLAAWILVALVPALVLVRELDV